jgi:hypothetical protein
VFSGGVDAKATEISDKEKFVMQILNRPQLVLQTSQQSFVGTNPADDKVKTNKPTGEILHTEYADGKYTIKNSAGKYFNTGDKVALGSTPEKFALEIHGNKLAIRDEKGKYLKSENQGWMTLGGDDKPDAASFFDF